MNEKYKELQTVDVIQYGTLVTPRKDGSGRFYEVPKVNEAIEELVKHINTLVEENKELKKNINDWRLSCRREHSSNEKMKNSIEEILHYLMDNKLIKSWYYNGTYHIELKENKSEGK